MKLRTTNLPAYQVLAIQDVLKAGEDVSIPCDALCSEIKKVSSLINFPLSAIENMYGIAIFQKDWTQKKVSFITYEECIVLSNDQINIDGLSKLLSNSDRSYPYYLKSTQSGMYAVCGHKGSYSKIKHVYEYVLDEWFKNSEFLFSGGPILEIYKYNQEKVPECDRLIDICFPILDIKRLYDKNNGRYNAISI